VTKNTSIVETGIKRFEKLETGYQKQILGEKRFQMYADGFDLNNFVGSSQSDEFGLQHFIKPLSDF